MWVYPREYDADVQVARYTALIGGIGYGIYHGRALQTQWDERQKKHHEQHQADLIAQAKEAYAKLQATVKPPQPASSGAYSDMAPALAHTAAVVTNPDDPNFDLEKALQHWEKSE